MDCYLKPKAKTNKINSFLLYFRFFLSFICMYVCSFKPYKLNSII